VTYLFKPSVVEPALTLTFVTAKSAGIAASVSLTAENQIHAKYLSLQISATLPISHWMSPILRKRG
jgi:hypothetical protein